MQLTEAVKLMGPSLALHVFAKADRFPLIPFSEWFEVFQVVRSSAASREHASMFDQSQLAHTVAREMCDKAATFEQKCSALETMIECSCMGDEFDEVIRMKYSMLRSVVANADTFERIARVHTLIIKASRYWSTTLNSVRELPRFRAGLLQTGMKLAKSFDDWLRVIRCAEREDNWEPALDHLIETAATIEHWTQVHQEIVRLDPRSKRRERAVMEIAKRLAE